MERVRLDDGKADKLDLLWGAEAIAKFIGLPRHRTHHLIYSGRLPVKRIGRQLVASRAELRDYFARLGG